MPTVLNRGNGDSRVTYTPVKTVSNSGWDADQWNSNCWRNQNWKVPFGKLSVSDKIPYDTVITYLGIDPSEMRTCSLPNLYVSIAALFSHQLKQPSSC